MFVLGDNRDNSTDSRFVTVGMVDQRNILGKVVFNLYPVSKIGLYKWKAVVLYNTKYGRNGRACGRSGTPHSQVIKEESSWPRFSRSSGSRATWQKPGERSRKI